MTTTAPNPPPSRRGWVVGVVALCVALVLVGVTSPWFLVIGFVLLAPLERRFARHPVAGPRPGRRTDLWHALLSGLGATAGVIVAAVVWLVLLAPLIAWNPPALAGLRAAWDALPLWGQAVGGLLVFEFFGYWAHRLQHTVPALWRVHAVHHSSERLDWLASTRFHPAEGLIIGAIVAPPLVLLGAEPAALGMFSAVTSSFGVFIHMNVRWRLRWLDPFLGTPDHHHWHHSLEPEAIDTNFSGLAPWMDRLFGTHYLPAQPPPDHYGVAEPLPDTYPGQLAAPFRRRRPAGAEALGSVPAAP